MRSNKTDFFPWIMGALVGTGAAFAVGAVFAAGGLGVNAPDVRIDALPAMALLLMGR